MAGAMRPESAGLKSITFKHLALASQSLGLVLALLPHLKAILAAYVPEAQRHLLSEVDSALADYERHQQELFAKFVSILEERRRGHVSALADALAPSEERRRPEPSNCIKLVVRDITQMHKQLLPLLSNTQLHTLFVQVLAAFDAGLLGAYKGVVAQHGASQRERRTTTYARRHSDGRTFSLCVWTGHLRAVHAAVHRR